MTRLRFSVSGMMALLLGFALFLASVRYPSGTAAAGLLLATLAILTFAILAVIYRAEDRRAFWLGFALFGWGYMGLAWEPLFGNDADRSEMFTSVAIDQL